MGRWEHLGVRELPQAHVQPRRKKKRRGPSGKGPPPGLKTVLRGRVDGRPHSLWVVELEGRLLYFCMKCGCYAEHSARKLTEPCVEFRNRGAREKLARLAKGCHPHDGRRVVGKARRVIEVVRDPSPCVIEENLRRHLAEPCSRHP